jgi:hypothetical protein
LTENKRLSTRNTKGTFLLQNLAYCGDCGGKLNAAADTRFHYKRLADGSKKRYEKESVGYHYTCAHANRYQEESHTSPYTFDGADLDAQFWAYVADKMVTHPELIIEQVLNRQQELKEQGDNLDSEIAQKRRQIAAVEQDRMTYTRQLGRGKITEAVYDVLIAETNESEADYQEQLAYLLTLRDDQRKVRTATAYAEKLLADIRQKLPEINQTPEELTSLPEDRQRWVMSERQRVIRSLVDRAIVYSDGNITIKGLIAVSDFIEPVSETGRYSWPPFRRPAPACRRR